HAKANKFLTKKREVHVYYYIDTELHAIAIASEMERRLAGASDCVGDDEARTVAATKHLDALHFVRKKKDAPVGAAPVDDLEIGLDRRDVICLADFVGASMMNCDDRHATGHMVATERVDLGTNFGSETQIFVGKLAIDHTQGFAEQLMRSRN